MQNKKNALEMYFVQGQVFDKTDSIPVKVVSLLIVMLPFGSRLYKRGRLVVK